MKIFKGLHRDNHPSDQPEGTYRNARNIVVSRRRGAISNEEGTTDTSYLPEGYSQIGRIPLPDGRIVVFSADGSGGSEVGIIEKDDKYYTLANDPRFNFSLQYPIEGIARIAPRRIQSQQYPEPETLDQSDILTFVEDVSLTVTSEE